MSGLSSVNSLISRKKSKNELVKIHRRQGGGEGGYITESLDGLGLYR